MTLSGRLFPHFVCRIAGLPAGHLEAMRSQASVALSREIEQLEQAMTERRGALTEALFAAVHATEDRRQRGALLQAKRDVHNLRKLRAGLLRKVDALVPQEVAAELHAFRELGDARHQRQLELERAFPREKAASRRQFRRALRDSDFQKGLLLSSRSLHAALERYSGTPVDALGSKEQQIERGLMRYFSRTAMKATPFGMLCAIAAGELVDDEIEGWDFVGDPRSKRSRIRLNKSLYGNLLHHLHRRPEIRRDFHVELNPTLANEGSRWAFLSNVNGKEVFQRLKPNPVVELVRNTVAESAHLPLRELVEGVAGREEIDAANDEIEAYLIRLLEIGLLRFRIGIREQEVDWDQPFRAILEAIDDPDARELADFLKELRQQSEAYAQAGIAQRPELLATTSELVRSAFTRIDAKIGQLANLPFYEDAGSAATLRLSKAAMDPALESLVEYVDLTSRLAWPRGEQATARHFFDGYYADGISESVPLLKFYEDFYREHFKEHLRRQKGQGGAAEKETPDAETTDGAVDLQNPFGLELTRQIQAANEAFTRLIQERWRESPDAEEIRLESEDLRRVVSQVPAPAVPCRSVSAFVQWLPGFGPEGRGGLVANLYHNGFGKYFSRFLYLMPERVQRRLFANNEQMTEQRVAEICGDGAFNGNLHPPLMSWELSYPTGESGPSQTQLKTSEIGVAKDPEDPNALCLIHRPTGKRVLPVDLGFLNSHMRPPLYQLLSRFTPPASFNPMIPETPEPTPSASPPDPETDEAKDPSPAVSPDGVAADGADSVSPETVFYRPRITYRGTLVLGRRLWIVPAAAFPRPWGDETAAGYFLRVESWRAKHGIPSQVFLQMRPLPSFSAPPATPATPVDSASPDEGAATQDATADPEPADKPRGPQLRGDLYKPQYIDFHNPLLLDLFARAPGLLDNFLVVLAERLPGKEHLATHGDEAFATEFVVQIDFTPSGREAPSGDEGAPGNAH
ncbi:MAG: lantibiotic dehydratase [Acidobacteriota bacterium]